MWTRRELKERAKTVLRGIYWKAFLVSIVIVIAGGGGGSGGGGSSNRRNISSNNHWNFQKEDFFTNLFLYSLIIIGIIIFIFCLRVFLGYALEVGGRRYFVQSAQYRDNKKCFKFAFEGRNYIGIMSTMLLKGIQNFLWYLLFIIPGIVQSYAYSMVPYILAENPNIGAKKAIRLSNEMTHGHKADMFVLDLSFIGWYLLGMLALLVGVLFVNPYINATKAELYLVLRQNALDYNMCTYEDLS